jgi:hypothetical protein
VGSPPTRARPVPRPPTDPPFDAVVDVPRARGVEPEFRPHYPSITGGIFEFGFADAIQQMWAAFVDELVHGEDMRSVPVRDAGRGRRYARP